MSAARSIVSFLPSATEMACALGLGDQLMGISHECDYPPETKDKPIVVRSVLPIERMSQREIDSAVAERLRNGLSLYQVDESLMRAIAPDLILTQDLCQVCAPSGNEVARLLQVLPSKPCKTGEDRRRNAQDFRPAAGVLHGMAGPGLLLRPLGAGNGADCGWQGRAWAHRSRFGARSMAAGSRMGTRSLDRHALRLRSRKGSDRSAAIVRLSRLVRSSGGEEQPSLRRGCKLVLCPPGAESR